MDVNREHFVLSPRTLRLLGTFATPLRRAGIQVRSVVGAHAHVLELLAFRTEIRVAQRSLTRALWWSDLLHLQAVRKTRRKKIA